MDHISPDRRSWLMSRVKGRDTGPELKVRRAAHALGHRFRLQRRNLPGTPDLVFPKRRLAIFVHGCFWHRHPGCRLTSIPKTRPEFWQAKFDRNVERDGEVKQALEALGWRVGTIWECETRDPQTLTAALERIIQS